jgi:hypothetical protein
MISEELPRELRLGRSAGLPERRWVTTLCAVATMALAIPGIVMAVRQLATQRRAYGRAVSRGWRRVRWPLLIASLLPLRSASGTHSPSQLRQ